MKIKYDTHLHTDYSPDSSTPVTDQINQAKALGLDGIGITDHMDHGFPEDQLPPGWAGTAFNFDTDEYVEALEALKQDNPDIQLFIGVECGLLPDPEVIEFNRNLCMNQAMDYSIGSIHLIDKKDPYYPAFWENRPLNEVMKRYFEITLENIELFHDFQTLGHLDYASRYAPDLGGYNPYDYLEITDAIMQFLIRKDIALEINTSSLKKGYEFTNPHPVFIKRYYELGGRLITIGSDSHTTDGMAFGFEETADLLLQTGYREYTVFRQKTPVLFPIG